MSLNQELRDDPLAFANKYCIKGGDDARRAAEQQKQIEGYYYSKMKGLAKISYLDCQKMDLAAELLIAPKGIIDEAQRRAALEERSRAVNEGADTIVITAHEPAAGLVPAWFLPWDPRGGTVSMSIPSKAKFELGFWEANKNRFSSEIGGGKFIEQYPNLFLTAAINGCSVFVTGSSREPTVFHGGKGSGVEGDAIKVWRDMVLSITGKSAGEMNMAEVNKSMYIKDGVTKDSKGGHTTPTANRFAGALDQHYEKGPVQIREVRPWGAVFGFCSESGEWTFYLQENATIRYDVVDKKLMGLMKKKPKPFSVSRPMTVRQIFPGGGGGAIMRSGFTWRSLN